MGKQQEKDVKYSVNLQWALQQYLLNVDWSVVHNVKKQDMAPFRSPVHQRKLTKLFDKYVPSIHHLVPLIIDYLNSDRLDVVIVEGTALIADSISDIGFREFNCSPVHNIKPFMKIPYELDQ